MTETQGANSWCGAYAAAMILNNKNDAFSDDDLIRYANTRGVYPKKISRPTTWNETLVQLRKSNGYGERGNHKLILGMQ